MRSSAKPLFLILLGAIVFANAVTAPFVFDDAHAIVENTHIRQLWPIREALTAPPQSALSGRPVVSLSLALNAALAGGLSPAAFHAWNVGIHILAALLLFGIARRTLTEGTAFAIAALWMIHPLQTEVVDYVIERTESMMGLFYLATLYAAIRGWTGVAVAACALGMATKESMATAPLAVLAYDLAFRERSLVRVLKARPRLYAGLAATWLLLAALNLSGPRSHTAGWSTPVTSWTYALNQAPMIATYLRLAFWPSPLIVDYGPVTAVRVTSVLLPGVVVVGLMALTIFAWCRSRPAGFLGVWFFLTLAVTSSIVPIATEVGAERRMYLPLAAVVAAVVVGVRAWTPRVPAMTALSCALVALAALTMVRNAVYHDPIALWEGVVAERPHGRARHALGFALQQAGRRHEAIAQYRLAAPEYSLAHYNLALQLIVEGRDEEAIAEFRERLRMEPDDVDARGALADVLLRRQRFAEASREYVEFLRREPGNAAAHNNLGLALVQQQRVAEAVREFRAAVALAPANTAARQNLSRALAMLAPSG